MEGVVIDVTSILDLWFEQKRKIKLLKTKTQPTTWNFLYVLLFFKFCSIFKSSFLLLMQTVCGISQARVLSLRYFVCVSLRNLLKTSFVLCIPVNEDLVRLALC